MQRRHTPRRPFPGSYGGLARFTDLRRLKVVGKSTLIGCSGEYSDFQYILSLLDELV